MLASVPRLNPTVRWDHLDSGEIMATYRQEVRGMKGLFMRLFAAPETAQIVLDDAGTRVVDAIDGTRTVGELIALVADEFRVSRKEAEVSLLKYMEMLGRRRLVGFEVAPDGGAEE